MTKKSKKLKKNDSSKQKSSKPVNKNISLKNLGSISKVKKLKKIKISKHLNYLKNPSINHFNINSHFVYDLNEVNEFLDKNKNKNSLKVNENELNYLNSLIEKIDLDKDYKNKTVFIMIKASTFNTIKRYTQIKEIDDPLTRFIKEQLDNVENRNLLSCRKLTNLYYEKTGNKTNRTSVNKIIREKLGYRYKKIVPKNKIIKSNKNILISFTFIKIITRCLNLGFKIIYVDESIICNKNNNFRCLIKKSEEIFYNYERIGKLNLLMAVNEKEVIYYQLNKETTNEESFLLYMKNLLDVLKNKKEEHYIIVMDNLSCHKTEKLISFYKDNKINVLFNSPYLSKWNCIELSFRNLKKNYYNKFFANIDELKKYIENFLTTEEFLKSLNLNFGETLKEYRKFILDNQKKNLNIINIE